MSYIIFTIAISLGIALSFLYKPLLRFIAEKKAIPLLDEILFKEANISKEEILNIIHKLTNNRFSNYVLMDYFYKIKGLQIININNSSSFWLKTYLSTPTKIRLNYFEQVRFYKTFLNYSEIKPESYESKNNFLDSIEKTVEVQLTAATRNPSITV